MGEVAVGAFDDVVEDAVVGLELGELEVGEFHEVERFVEVARFVDDQRGVPVDDDQVVVVIAESSGWWIRRLPDRRGGRCRVPG